MVQTENHLDDAVHVAGVADILKTCKWGIFDYLLFVIFVIITIKSS